MMKRSFAVVGCLLWSLASRGLSADVANPEDIAPLLVRVMNGEGRPVAGATVRAVPEQTDPEKAEPGIEEETSAEGVVRISGLPADRISRVLVERAGYTPELRSLVADATREVRIALRPGGLLVGQVVDEKGRPVPGAEVELAGSPFEEWGWESPSFLEHHATHRTRTGPAGRFRFRDLPAGQFELTIRHSEHATLIADRPVEGRTAGRLGTFVLRRGKTLAGTVTDAAGRPVAGARIWALPWSELGTRGFPAPSTTTAGDGTFAVPHRGQGIELWVCADGFLQQNATVVFPEEPVQVRLRPAGSVRGRVLGRDGSPVAGAVVGASRADGIMACGFSQIVTPCPQGEPATTDAEGWFHLERLWPAWYTVTASTPGWMAATSSPTRAAGGEPVEVELRFQEGSAVSGRVVASDGRPIPGATAWINSAGTLAEATSQADGFFRIEGVAAGRTRLMARADGYDSTERVIHVSGGEVRVDLVLELEQELEHVEVRGRVLGPDGAPVEGARVSSSGRSVHSAWDGSFTLRLCVCGSAGERVVQAEKQGFVKGLAQLRLEGEPVNGVEIRLETGTRVHGDISGLTAEEMQRVMIRLPEEDMEPPVHADAEGRFEIGPVTAGTWEVAASLDGRTAGAEVTAEPGEAEAFVELAFTSLREVSGRVLGADGEPLAGIEVSFRGMGDLSAAAWTRADGTFSAAVPEGDLTVSVQHGAREHTQPLGAETGPVTGLEIGLRRGVTLRGRILGVPLWEMMSVRLEGRSPLWGEVDLDGGWSVQGIAPGRWTLIVTRDITSQEIRRTIEIPDDFESPDVEIDLDFTTIPVPSEEEPETSSEGS
jgi:protocatechuate 3,4-dioxygenase beta subunit